MFFFPPNAKAPEYILGSISIKPNEFIEFLNTQTTDEKGFLRLVVKVSKGGKPYVAVDNWVKGAPRQSEETEIAPLDDF